MANSRSMVATTGRSFAGSAQSISEKLQYLANQASNADGHPAMGQHIVELDDLLARFDRIRTRVGTIRDELAVRFPQPQRMMG